MPVLLAGLAATVALTMWHARGNEKLRSLTFFKEESQLVETLRVRFASYGHGLRGGRGIMLADAWLDEARYDAYARSRDLPQEFPGATGMAFIRHIEYGRLPEGKTYAQSILRGLAARRQMDSGNAAMVVEHAYPPQLKATISGYDIATLPSLRNAALLAVQRNDMTLAYGAVSSLTGDDQSRDLLLLLPIFRADSYSNAYSALLGWSAMILDIDRVFADLDDELLNFEVYDVSGKDTPYLLRPARKKLDSAAVVARNYDLDFGGRVWRIRTLMHEDPALAETLVSPALTAVAGIFVSLLLAGTVSLLIRIWRQAMTMADRNAEKTAIFALSPDGFVAFDDERRVSYLNPAFLRLTGYRADEVIGSDEYMFSVYLARDCSPKTPFVGIEAMRRMTESARQATGHYAHAGGLPQTRLELNGKKIVELQLRQADSANVSQILYIRDITHEFEVDRMKSEFLAHAAHELRTPMASIYGYTEMLMLRDFDVETRKDIASTIHKQSGWLIEIVNELLDLARIDAGQGKDYFIESVQLAPLVEEVVDALQIDPGYWPVTLDLPPDQDRALADAAKLRQVLVNVIGNARKYSPAGGGIDIRGVERCENDSFFVGIAVIDHGLGMSPEEVARIGERFFRADTSGNVPGTGLGMAIAMETLGQLDGSLDVASTPGVGSTFTIWLPAARAIVAHATPGPAVSSQLSQSSQ